VSTEHSFQGLIYDNTLFVDGHYDCSDNVLGNHARSFSILFQEEVNSIFLKGKDQGLYEGCQAAMCKY